MNTAILAAWILATMESLAPSSRTPFRDIPETSEHRRARYEDTALAYAEAIAAVPDAGFPFRTRKGGRGELTLAAWVVGVALHESGFLYSVDSGARVGDGGRAWCTMQINLARGKTTAEGWTGKELVADRRKCALSGVAILARHLAACSNLPFADRTSGYASGRCQVGLPAPRRQAHIVAKIFKLPRPKGPAATPATEAPPQLAVPGPKPEARPEAKTEAPVRTDPTTSPWRLFQCPYVLGCQMAEASAS